jgi:hypothetical protein
LKRRLWGIIGLGVILLLLAGGVDWWQLGAGQDTDRIIQSPLAFNEEMLLVACDSSQKSYTGPLVPGQSTPDATKSLENIEPAEAIPSGAWSARAGFSISSTTDPGYWAQMLGSGWYLDWSMRTEITANGPEHWQMVRVHEDCISPSPEAIQSSASSFPGQVWIIGNEPDVIWQDDVTPSSYAVNYHALYYLIKSSDPIAQVAVGGISQASPLRLEYLDQVLQTYQDRYHEALPTDWWTVHGYVLREEQNSWGVEIPPGMDVTQGQLYEVSDHGRLDLFEKQLVAFRTWMKTNGYQDTPLALTEFGILMPTSYGFPTEFIADYLEQTFAWLYQSQDSSTGYPDDSYHLVQKWAWFSISDPNYPSSNLGDISNGRLTLIGERFRSVVSKKGQ